MKVRACINNYRSSASKVRLVAPLISGLSVKEARLQLEHLRKGCAEDIKNLLDSAVANAENNYGLSKENLIVQQLIAQEGKTMKRWRPRAHGRAAQILKRTCNVIVVVDDGEESVKKAKKTRKIEKNEVKGSAGEEKKYEETEKNQQKRDEKRNDKDIFRQEKKKSTNVEGQKIFRRKSF